jgi:hypothetical protein
MLIKRVLLGPKWKIKWQKVEAKKGKMVMNHLSDYKTNFGPSMYPSIHFLSTCSKLSKVKSLSFPLASRLHPSSLTHSLVLILRKYQVSNTLLLPHPNRAPPNNQATNLSS